MASDKDFVLKFGSLSLGDHEFTFRLDQLYFKSRIESLVTNGNVVVLLFVEKTERHLSLMFKLNGEITRVCDICLSELNYPIKCVGELMVKLTDQKLENQVDLIHLSSNTIELDLEDLFYDTLVLSLPMKIKCSDSSNREECDKIILELLNKPEEESAPNPEWQKLKNLFNKN